MCEKCEGTDVCPTPAVSAQNTEKLFELENRGSHYLLKCFYKGLEVIADVWTLSSTELQRLKQTLGGE